MVLAMLRIKPLSGKKKEALEILQSMKEPLRLKHGCIGSQVYESHSEEDRILYLEYWNSKEYFHRHIQSDLYLRVLTVMELSQETPVIEFHEFSAAQGMELIQALRQASKL